MAKISVTINDKKVVADIDPRKLLLDFIRDDAGLTGAKRGCNEGKCGACTVILDGLTVKACNLLAMRANGCAVTTIEGLGDNGNLGPIQQCFHENHSLQCGFCTAGFLMSAKYLLEHNPSPSDAEIREAIHGNVCRCTGYQKIVEGIRAAAQRLRESREEGNNHKVETAGARV